MNNLTLVEDPKTEVKGEAGTKKLEEHLLEFRAFLGQKGKGKGYIDSYMSPVGQLIRFVAQRLIFYPHQVTRELLAEYQLALYEERDFKFDTVRIYSYRIKEFLRYLNNKGIDIVKDFDILPKPKPKDERLKRYYTFEDLLTRYLAVQRKWLSYGYSNNIQKHLRAFSKYLRTQGIKNVYSVTEAIILKYRDFLREEYKEGRDSAIVIESQIDRLGVIGNFFKFLYRERIIEKIPAFNIDWKAYFNKIREEAKSLPKPARYKDWVPESLKELMQKFADYERIVGKSPKTISSHRKTLRVFFDFLDSKGMTSIDQVTKRTILDYYTYLINYKGARGKGVSSSTRALLLLSTKTFFKFLARFDYIQKDPTQDIEPIKEEKALPRDYMSEKEMFRVLEKPNINDSLGLRDKSVMEVFFSTGIRKNELCQLNLNDIDYHEGMLRVNHPKGGPNYQRIIPIGDIALSYVKQYIQKSRPNLENGHDTQALFLSYKGNRLDKDTPLAIAKKYSFQAGIRKNITPHSFRVSCATSMLKNKAGLRHVQEQLGHRRITSTQIYTRLCPLDLKEVHKRCHPRENSHI